MDALYTHFASTSVTAGLLPKNRLEWNDIATNIINNDVVATKRKELQRQAAKCGEYEVISHDETFKVLFSLIEQKKMSQKSGELHALHTFRDYKGCTIVALPQRSTSETYFINAVESTFEQHLTAEVKPMFSDCPTRIYQASRTVIKSFVAVGENPIHLPIRLEYC